MSSSPQKNPDPGTPPPIKPDNVLDSIFSRQGPMPSASLALRALALLLDFILMTAVSMVIIWKIALPQSHPGALGELMQWWEAIAAWLESGQTENPIPQPSQHLASALRVANEIQLLMFWLYFAIGEAFFAGSSMGKRICRIRTVSTVTLGAPPVFAGIIRSGLKTLTLPLFALFPLTLTATLLALFFNKRRQLGHDLFARTAVVDEKHVNLQPRQ